MQRLSWCVLLACVVSLSASTRVAFLPFKDNVRLREAWDLAVDVPRWFSQTVDTIGGMDSSVLTVSYDTVSAVLEENGLKRKEYLSASYLVRLASRFGADYVVTGTVTKFKVMKRAINTDAPVNTTHKMGSNTYGKGGVTVMGGLQSYTADIGMDIDIYSAETGSLAGHVPFNTTEKDGGFKIWLPFQPRNPETNYHNMSRSPFGSVYFCRNVAGALMKHYSLSLKRRIQTLEPQKRTESPGRPSDKQHIHGTILERVGTDVYIDLGADDRLMEGEVLEVMSPDHPVTSASGDTLGWVEKPAGLIRVRFIKAAHFSQATVVEESGGIAAGCGVRVRLPQPAEQ